MFVDFDNIEVVITGNQVIFREKEYGIGQLDYLELVINGHIDYVYYHFGDDPMTRIVISIDEYHDWIKNAIQNGAHI